VRAVLVAEDRHEVIVQPGVVVAGVLDDLERLGELRDRRVLRRELDAEADAASVVRADRRCGEQSAKNE